MTGGRLKRLKKFLKNETFFLHMVMVFLNVNIKRLMKFHLKIKKLNL